MIQHASPIFLKKDHVDDYWIKRLKNHKLQDETGKGEMEEFGKQPIISTAV